MHNTEKLVRVAHLVKSTRQSQSLWQQRTNEPTAKYTTDTVTVGLAHLFQPELRILLFTQQENAMRTVGST